MADVFQYENTGNVACGAALAVTGASTLTGNVACGAALAVTWMEGHEFSRVNGPPTSRSEEMLSEVGR